MAERRTGRRFEALLLGVLGLALAIPSCGKAPGHDKTGYLLAKKLDLTDEQAAKVDSILAAIERRRDEDRTKLAGDPKALLQAARARHEDERTQIAAILDERQRVAFEEMMAPYYGVTDRTLILTERLRLDRATMKKIDPILAQAPPCDEHDPRTESVHRQIERFLDDRQKAEFRAMVSAPSAGPQAPQPQARE